MTITSITIYTAWLIFGALLVCFVGCCKVSGRHRRAEEQQPEPDLSGPTARAHGFIRANDWEFIPWNGRNDFDTDEIVPSKTYWAMRQMEERDRIQRESRAAQRRYVEFQEAMLEPEEDEDSGGDDLYRELGGEG